MRFFRVEVLDHGRLKTMVVKAANAKEARLIVKKQEKKEVAGVCTLEPA
ncbi:MAG TPA: hypothetical protein P5560_00005 [Thermotogota bacterium]|nr:hypothetical protein [Thermotogota bacterium]HRW91314.1 hypothetical protein [Thermotogota bacterium]